VGDEFQFMRRSIETDMVADMARKLLDSLGKRKPLFAFYISCLGRVKKFLGTEKEESDEIRNVIGTKMPLIGIYSGVEIARIRDDVLPLDWTGVLCIFSKPVE
jgi:small ligand-binding sensory domain FIST